MYSVYYKNEPHCNSKKGAIVETRDKKIYILDTVFGGFMEIKPLYLSKYYPSYHGRYNLHDLISFLTTTEMKFAGLEASRHSGVQVLEQFLLKEIL